MGMDLSSSSVRAHKGVSRKNAKKDEKVMDKRLKILHFLHHRLDIEEAEPKRKSHYIITRQEVMFWHCYSAAKKIIKIDSEKTLIFHAFNRHYDPHAMSTVIEDSDDIKTKLVKTLKNIYGHVENGTKVKPLLKHIMEEHIKGDYPSTVLLYTDGSFSDEKKLAKHYKKKAAKLSENKSKPFGILILVAHKKGVNRKHLHTLNSDEGQLVPKEHNQINVKDCLRISTEPYRIISMARGGKK